VSRQRRKISNISITDSDDDQLRAMCILEWSDFYRNAERFILDVLCGVNWAEKHGIGMRIVESIMGLSIAYDVIGLPWLAARVQRRALDVARAMDDPLAKALADFGGAYHKMMSGEWGAAVADFESAMTTFERHRKLREYGVAAATLTFLLQCQGNFTRGRAVTEKLVSIADDAGDKHSAMYAALHESFYQMHAGQLPNALALMRKGVEYLRTIPDYQIGCYVCGRIALCLIWMGDTVAADEAIAEGLQMASHTVITPQMLTELQAVMSVQQLRLFEYSGDRVAAARARRAVSALRRLARSFVGAKPIAQFAEGCLEWLSKRHEVAQIAWDRSIESAIKLNARYQLAITYQEMGRLMRNAKHLQAALRIFEEDDLRFQTAQTLRYLGESVLVTAPDEASRCFSRALSMHESMAASHEKRLTQNSLDGLLREKV
jgi:tetratricopeptide (TPR) repeat protein